MQHGDFNSPRFEIDHCAVEGLRGNSGFGFDSRRRGLELEQLHERADNESDFQLAEVFSRTDAWPVAESEVQEFL